MEELKFTGSGAHKWWSKLSLAQILPLAPPAYAEIKYIMFASQVNGKIRLIYLRVYGTTYITHSRHIIINFLACLASLKHDTALE
jgi:hypothetical protein